MLFAKKRVHLRQEINFPRLYTSRNLVRPSHLFQLPKHFKIFHTVCKISKYLGNWKIVIDNEIL